jgi:hypothetical protein
MSQWITDRLPTEDDAFEDWVFVMEHGDVQLYLASFVRLGMPWQPIVPPAPDVKPKRWTVTWEQKGITTLWTLCSYDQSVHTLHGDLPDEVAQRICDIYNEEMP